MVQPADEYSPRSWRRSSRSPRRSSRCDSPAISCGAIERGGGPSSPRGRPGSLPTHSPPARSPGAPRPAGARPRFALYYLGGGLLTAALLGAGSLLLVGRRWASPVALVYVGLAVGVAIAAPLQIELSGTEIPEAQDVLDLWPARILAILGNSLGTLAVVVVAIATFRARPLGNVLILAGIAVAAIGSGLAGLGVGALAPAVAARRRPPLRRVRGPVVAHGATPTRARRRPRSRPTPRRSRRGRLRAD